MEADIAQALAWAILIAGLGGVLMAILALGLPAVPLAYNAFWESVLAFVPYLRRFFDPNTALSKTLERKGIPAEIADRLAELGADQLEDMARKYLAAPPAQPETLNRP